MVPSSALDIATDPETMELRIPEEILNPLPLSDAPPSSSNNTEPIILLSKPDAEVNALPFPSVDEPGDIRGWEKMKDHGGLCTDGLCDE